MYEARRRSSKACGDPDANLPGVERGQRFPEDQLLAQRVSSGVPDGKAFRPAAAQASRLRDLTIQSDPELAQAAWQFLGPRTVGGRVVDAALDPLNEGGLYVATSTAGRVVLQ